MSNDTQVKSKGNGFFKKINNLFKFKKSKKDDGFNKLSNKLNTNQSGSSNVTINSSNTNHSRTPILENKPKHKRISLPPIPNFAKKINRLSYSPSKEKRNSSILNNIGLSKLSNVHLNKGENNKIRAFSLESYRLTDKDEATARKQLRSIRSFDEMINHGFDPLAPNQPRPLTVSFSITPRLRSENLP